MSVVGISGIYAGEDVNSPLKHARKQPASKAEPGDAAHQLQLYMPLPDYLRALPWAAVRSALFAPTEKGARDAVTRKRIAAVGDYKIIYTGIRLDQGDLDVFELLIYKARAHPGTCITYATRALLADLGRAYGSKERERLYDSLSRLSACEVEINRGPQSYGGSLIDEQTRDDDSGTHCIRINPRLADLFWFEGVGGTFSSWRHQHRLALGSKQLAKWLLTFMAGNEHPLTLPIDKLRELCGSKYERDRDFRAALNRAASDVNAVQTDKVISVGWHAARRQITLAVAKRRPPPAP